MSPFKRMRLIPDYMYERLQQEREPRSVQFGDTSNPLHVTLSQDIANVLTDPSRSIEERVRVFNQHLVRQLVNKTAGKEEETGTLNNEDKGGSVPTTQHKEQTNKETNDHGKKDRDRMESSWQPGHGIPDPDLEVRRRQIGQRKALLLPRNRKTFAPRNPIIHKKKTRKLKKVAHAVPLQGDHRQPAPIRTPTTRFDQEHQGERGNRDDDDGDGNGQTEQEEEHGGRKEGIGKATRREQRQEQEEEEEEEEEEEDPYDTADEETVDPNERQQIRYGSTAAPEEHHLSQQQRRRHSTGGQADGGRSPRQQDSEFIAPPSSLPQSPPPTLPPSHTSHPRDGAVGSSAIHIPSTSSSSSSRVLSSAPNVSSSSPPPPPLPPSSSSSSSTTTRTSASDAQHQKLVSLLESVVKEGGNRAKARSEIEKLIREYFIIDPSSGKLTFKDDGTSELRGAEFGKLVNFLYPLKNIHPAKKPAGFAAVIEILRSRKLFDASLFPNNTLVNTFKEYGSKPTAYKKRITDWTKFLHDSHNLETLYKGYGSGAASARRWTAFS